MWMVVHGSKSSDAVLAELHKSILQYKSTNYFLASDLHLHLFFGKYFIKKKIIKKWWWWRVTLVFQ